MPLSPNGRVALSTGGLSKRSEKCAKLHDQAPSCCKKYNNASLSHHFQRYEEKRGGGGEGICCVAECVYFNQTQFGQQTVFHLRAGRIKA